ncbi:FAD-binding protein [uncultured Adlercreutzia sp.]|uniref:FAD-dependent oxidoreductase n=1 Tax=uncultured Adlercreutzia sp. TaxID=875803 RepID=UPI0026767168|nr:FAD-binding protein [uncultured Adlercreutzia sp.]
MIEVSRRSFFKGGAAAALGGAALLAPGALAGCASGESTKLGNSGSAEALAPGVPVIYDADVVVVGSGVAGLQATIVAGEAGANVMVIDKKRFGHSGSSGMQTSGAMSSSEFEIDGDNPEVHLEDAVITGRYIVDQQLGKEVLQAYYDDRVLMESENDGNLMMRIPQTGTPLIGLSKGQHRRWIGYRNFNLARKAEATGARIVDSCTVTKILTDENGVVCGVTALDFKTGQFFAVRAKAVILATGGVNANWGAADVTGKYSGSASGLVGDGHALALPLGVEFRDLEFRSHKGDGKLLCAPVGIGLAGAAWEPGLQGAETWTDKNGDRVFPDIESEEELSAREMAVKFYDLKNRGLLGPNGGVFAKMNLVGGDDVGSPNEHVYTQYQLSWEANGALPETVEVAPVSVYDYGGIVTDVNGATGVEGLFAVGECAMHSGAAYGSFRMYSSAMVIGRRAAQAAVARAQSTNGPTLNEDEVVGERDRLDALLSNDPHDGISVIDLRRKVQDAAWLGAGALRSDAACQAALEALDECEALVPSMRVDGKSRLCNLNWFDAIEVPHMIAASRMVIMACQARTESRGTHMRADYPLEDNDNWLKNVYVFERDGKIVTEVREVVGGDVALPEGGTEDQGGGTIELDWQNWA